MKLDYWKTNAPLKVIKELTYVQRDVLCMIAAFKDKGLKLHNHEIGEQLLLKGKYIGEIVNELKRAKYVRIEKAQSPYRVLYWSEKTKALLPATTDSRNKATSSPDRQLLPATAASTSSHSTKCIVSKEVKEVNTKEKPLCNDKTFPKDSNQNPQAFEVFWQAYPNKVARVVAERIWRKLSPDSGLADEIMSALERHKKQESWHKEGGRYIPKPENWLNDKRWLDQLVVPTGEGTSHDCTESEAEELMKVVQGDN